MSKGKLTAKQEQVLTDLVSGKNCSEAAEAAGVKPETVSGWMANDHLFVATLNARREDQWEASIARLRGLVGRAIETVEGLLQSKDEKTRLRAAALILRTAGLTDVKPTGPTDVEDVRIQHAQREQRRMLASLEANHFLRSNDNERVPGSS